MRQNRAFKYNDKMLKKHKNLIVKIAKTLWEHVKDRVKKVSQIHQNRVKTSSKYASDPSKSPKIDQKLKNRIKISSKIRKTFKQCSKTGSKTEKHGKTTKILKQCSKNNAFYEKSCTEAQENCSKSRISTKNHENRMVKKFQRHFENASKPRQNMRQIRQNCWKSTKSWKIAEKSPLRPATFATTLKNTSKSRNT